MSSNTADEAIKRIHLKAIQNKIDENAYEIVNTTARCAIYEWDDKGWQKTGIEGSLFIFKYKHNNKSLANGNDSTAEENNCSDTDGLAMAILNKTNTDTVKLELNNQVEVKKSEPYLMYFNKKSHGDQIVGIWFNDTFSFLQATQIITSHLNQLKKSDVEIKSDGKKSKNTAAVADSDKNVKNKLKKEGKSKDKSGKDKSTKDKSKINSPKAASKTNGVKVESSPKTGSSKTKINGFGLFKDEKFKEDTTEEDLLTIMTAKPGNSILEKLNKNTSEKPKKPKKNSNRSRSDSKGSATMDIITDASGLKPNEPLIVHQLFTSLGASKSVDTVQKKRNGSASSGKNGEIKPDILAMLQIAETKSYSRISSHEEKPSAPELPQENGLNLLASFSERLVDPPSTCSGAESGQTPKRKNKNKNKNNMNKQDKHDKTEKNINFEKSKLLTPKTLQPKVLEYPTSDNDATKKPTSKLLSPQVFKNKNNTMNNSSNNSHDALTTNLFKNKNSQAVKTPLTQLLLRKKNQFVEEEPSYGSTPPAITAETSENEDYEASTRITTSFAEAESQESQDNSILSRENLRQTMIQLLTNDDSFVDQIHAAYLSGLNKY